MARAHHDRRTPGDWLRGLFRQPPPGFYSRPAVYLSGDRMEIEHFCTVLFFDENRLCLRLAKGRFTVYGLSLIHISQLRSTAPARARCPVVRLP